MAGELTFTPSVSYGSRNRPIAGRIARLGARHADRLIVNSPFHAERIRQLRSGTQPDIVPLGTDTSRFSPRGAAAPLPGEVPVLCVASLVPVKCHAVLLRALALALAAAPGLHLHLVGEGTEEQDLRMLAQTLGIADSVHFHGPVDHGKLPLWYRGAAFCVLASAFESHCMAALEAAACGRVTVGSRVGSLPELCSPDYLCDAGDLDRLAGILALLAQDRKLRDSLSSRASASAHGRFSLDAAASAHEALYRQLLT
jgi:glycosyltransferase involved in cell wall biosynthesis